MKFRSVQQVLLATALAFGLSPACWAGVINGYFFCDADEDSDATLFIDGTSTGCKTGPDSMTLGCKGFTVSTGSHAFRAVFANGKSAEGAAEVAAGWEAVCITVTEALSIKVTACRN